MDLITFIQASTVNAPKETTKPSPSKQDNKADFARTLLETSELQDDTVPEVTQPEVTKAEKMESLEKTIVSILDELGIELDDISEIDFADLAESLYQLIGQDFSELAIHPGENQEKMLLSLLVNGDGKHNNEAKIIAPEISQFLEEGDVLETIDFAGKSDLAKPEKDFLSELVSLMDQNVDKDVLSKFLESHVDQLKKLIQKSPELKPIETEAPIILDDYEFTTKSDDQIVSPEKNINVKSGELAESEIIPSDVQIDKLGNRANSETQDVPNTIQQKAVFNEDRLKRITEKPLIDEKIKPMDDLKPTKTGLVDIVSDRPETMSDNGTDSKPFQPKQDSQAKEQSKPFSEGGFQSELQSEKMNPDGKTFGSQVTLDTSIQSKAIAETGKTESVRYTTPIEFVDHINGIITKHSKGLDGVQKITIQIYPKELGRIELELNLQNQRLSVDFTVTNERVKDIIETNFVVLADQLDAKGVQIDKLDAKTEKEQQQQKQQESQRDKPKRHEKDGPNEQKESRRQLGYNTFEVTA